MVEVSEEKQAYTVIIAEPEEEQRTRLARLVAEAAAELGRTVALHEASDGDAAAALIDDTEADLVVGEVLLGEESGLELLRRAKAGFFASTPEFFFVSRMTQEVDRYWALRNGAWAYEMKPSDDGVLQTRLQSFFKGESRDITDSLDALDQPGG